MQINASDKYRSAINWKFVSQQNLKKEKKKKADQKK